MPKVELSKTQCRNIADFIEMHFLDMVREDVDIDNFDWVVDMVNAYQMLRSVEGGKDTDVSTTEEWKQSMMNTFCGGKV